MATHGKLRRKRVAAFIEIPSRVTGKGNVPPVILLARREATKDFTAGFVDFFAKQNLKQNFFLINFIKIIINASDVDLTFKSESYFLSPIILYGELFLYE